MGDTTMTEMPKLVLNHDECAGGFFLTDGALPRTSLHSQVQELDVPRKWLAAHDAEVAANALRAVADTLGKDAITAAGLRMLADRKSTPELGSSEGSDR